ERLRHVSTHGAGRHPQAQLQQQFIGNALLTPGRVVMSYLADEHLQLRRNWGSSGLRLPAPEKPKSLVMPANKSVWLHHGQRLTPVEPTAQPDQSEAGGVGSTARFDLALLIKGKLFTPTVCLGVTSSVAYTYGYDNGRIGLTRCAVIAGARGDRWSRCQGGSTPPAGARSAHSGLAVGSRRASTADPGGFPRSKTT